MPSYYVEIVCGEVGLETVEAFSEAADAVALALFSLPDGSGARFVADPRNKTITFGLSVSSRAGGRRAVSKALALARTALHASGGATPDWEQPFEVLDKVATREPENVSA